jgi:gliding motility-associated lipoprotein GldH
MASCADETVYHTFRNIATRGWDKADTLVYEPVVDDSTARYELQVELRHRSDYPYQNLTLEMRCSNPYGQPVLTDTLHFTLINDNGTWLGTGWGGLYDIAATPADVHLPHTGRYRICITSLMTDTRLRGINDIGVKLKKY